jgi:hypothetical protein
VRHMISLFKRSRGVIIGFLQQCLGHEYNNNSKGGSYNAMSPRTEDPIQP